MHTSQAGTVDTPGLDVRVRLEP